MQDPLNETAEGPTLWTVTTLNREQEFDRSEAKLKASEGKEMVDGDSSEIYSLKMNLTVVNSTFNYTSTQEVRLLYNKIYHLLIYNSAKCILNMLMFLSFVL